MAPVFLTGAIPLPRRRVVGGLLFAVVAVLSLGLLRHQEHLEVQRAESLARLIAVERKAELAGLVRGAAEAARAMSLVASSGMDVESLGSLAFQMARNAPTLEATLVAPDGVVEVAYPSPLPGLSSGTALFSGEHTVLGGPRQTENGVYTDVQLLKPGFGARVLAATAVFRALGATGRRLWGYTAVTVRLDNLLRRWRAADLAAKVSFQLFVQGRDGSRQTPVAGNAVPRQPLLEETLSLGSTAPAFVLAVAPAGGVFAEDDLVWRAALVLVLLIPTVFQFSLLRAVLRSSGPSTGRGSLDSVGPKLPAATRQGARSAVKAG